MPEPTKLCAPMIAALEEDREALNMRFALRLRGGSRIDGAAFLAHLQEAVSPLVAQIHAFLPERSRAAVTALYEASLDLFAAALLGPEAKMTWVERVWRELLPGTTKLLAREPARVAGCLSNAAYQVAGQAGTRPLEWLARMQTVAPRCESVSELLEAGKVVAWQAGMVQYRTAALDAAGRLRPELAALSLGISEAISASTLQTRLERLRAKRWLATEDAANDHDRALITSVGSAGAFVGFGGLFLRPPIVEADGSRLFVSDGRWQWELLADRYGAWFRKLGEAPTSRSKPPAGVAIDRKGTIRWAKHSLSEPFLAAGTSSIAATAETLAVTIPTSHHVFLFGLTGGQP